MPENRSDERSGKDIQDVFQATPALQKADEDFPNHEIEYRFLTEHMADVIWTIDLNLRTTYVSPSIEKALGFTPRERKQQPIAAMITPDSLKSVTRALAEEIQREADGAADPDRSLNIEVEYYKKNGSTVWMENHMKAIRNDDGQMIGILGVSRDISRRKKDEKNLIAARKEWEAIFHAIGHPAMIIDADHKIITANQATFLIPGFNEAQITGKFCYEVFHAGNAPPASCPMAALLREGSLETVEMEMEAVNRSFLVSCTPVSDDKGNVSKFIHIATDITEKKKLETRLSQARKSEALGTFAGGIAHEFNNILGVIIGNTELAMDDVPEMTPVRDSLDEILTASLRAKEVVRQILSLSNKGPETRKPVKIGAITEKAIKLIRITTPAHIEIRQAIACGREEIFSSESDISQILMNLCSNAIHAMKEDTGILDIRLEPVLTADLSTLPADGAAAETYVKLTVKDSGKGIAPEIMDRICDPYFTTKEVNEGLGMGLAVVFGIVRRHNGTIKFESLPGKGTTVEVLLPVTGRRPEKETPSSADLPTGSERILVVDDEPALAQMLKIMLERQGYKVTGKTSSTDTLALLKEKSGHFDLLITDVAMPKMSGIELSKKALALQPTLPIIICTGYSDRFDAQKAKDMGIAAYVMKPYVKTNLLHNVRTVLDKKK